MRRAAKVDANHSLIVDGLRSFGVSVHSTAQLGKGFPDLCCGYKGRNVLLEVKDEGQSPSKKKLTPYEQIFAKNWRGQVATVECLNDALVVLGIRI